MCYGEFHQRQTGLTKNDNKKCSYTINFEICYLLGHKCILDSTAAAAAVSNGACNTNIDVYSQRDEAPASSSMVKRRCYNAVSLFRWLSSSSLTERGHIRWDSLASTTSVSNTHTSRLYHKKTKTHRRRLQLIKHTFLTCPKRDEARFDTSEWLQPIITIGSINLLQRTCFIFVYLMKWSIVITVLLYTTDVSEKDLCAFFV